MVLTILFFVLILIVLSLLLFFFFYVFVPAIEQQTKITDNIMLSHFEHVFEKLENRNQYSLIEKRAYISANSDVVHPLMNNYSAFEHKSCKVIHEIGKELDNFSSFCFGKGDCIHVCPQKAIEIKNKTAVITELCNGCGKCLNYCPQDIIKMIDIKSENKNDFSWPLKKGYEFWKICYKIIHRK